MMAGIIGAVIGVSFVWKSVVGWIESSEWGKFEHLEIVGLERLPEVDIRDVVHVEVGTNLMTLSLDSVASLVTALPAVEYARVLRRIPSRLIIRVFERRPVASVIRGEILLVDREGVMFPPIGIGEVIDLPTVTMKGITVQDERFFLAAGMIANIMDNYPVAYSNLSEVRIEPDIITMRLRQGGALVRTCDEIDDDVLTRLELFLEQKADQLAADLEYVDLRFPNIVVTGDSQ